MIGRAYSFCRSRETLPTNCEFHRCSVDGERGTLYATCSQQVIGDAKLSRREGFQMDDAAIEQRLRLLQREIEATSSKKVIYLLSLDSKAQRS